MTHEQKPESAEFRTRAEERAATRTRQKQKEALIRHLQAGATEFGGVGAEWVAERHIAEAEARGAAEQEAQGIEEAKDEGANYVLTSLALLFGRDGFEIRDGSETWEGDVNATLEGILKAGGLIDDEGDLLDLATLKDRLTEQRRKDAEGAEPVAWLIEDRSKGVPQCAHTPDRAVTDKAHSDKAARSNFKVSPLYTRPANVAALEDRVKELERTLRNVRASIEQAGPKVLVDTLWMPGQPETVVDYISAAVSEEGE